MNTQMTSLFFEREIYEYSTAEVALLMSGCIKFRVSFLANTGIDHFRSCTIAGTCMHVCLFGGFVPYR